MRIAFVIAAGAALWVQPASAGTIIQTASNHAPFRNPYSFQGFETDLGRLDKVTMEISGTEARIFGASYPDGATNPITIDWSIDGYANFYLVAVGTSDYKQLVVPISGTGQVVVTKGWSWDMTTNGSGVFDIDPAFIPDDDVNPGDYPFGNELRLIFGGPGFYNFSDTTFSSSEPIQINIHGGSCIWGSGDEACNNYQYRLTYDYTPAHLVGVPEPSTWAMMLLGFGAVGGAMRSRKRRQSPSVSYA